MPPGTESNSVDAEAVFRDEQVGANDARQFVLQRR